MAPKKQGVVWDQEEGKPISQGENGWGQMVPAPNGILEVNLQGSSASAEDEEKWATILVKECERAADGGWKFTGEFLGAEEGLAGEVAWEQFYQGGVHLCATDPCGVAEIPGLHVTMVRLWNPLTYKASYLTFTGESLLIELKASLKKKPPVRRATTSKPPPKKDAKTKTRGAQPKKDARKKDNPLVIEVSEGEEEGIGEIGEAPEREEEGRAIIDRKALRERLQATRARIFGGNPEEGRHGGGLSGGPKLKKSAPAVARKGLVAGTSLRPGQGTMMALSDPVDTRGDGMRSLVQKLGKRQDCNSLLLAQAVQSAEESRNKKRKEKKQSPAEVLVSLLRGKSVSKKGKKRKKKARMKPDPGGPEDPSSDEEDGSSSSEEEGQMEKEDSDSSCEPPLKRKAQKRPGSVMEMLVRHAQEQINQGNLLEPTEGENPMTQGVKISTYFALLIRPYHQAGSPLLRELYSLAQTIDYLRAGRLPEAADSLAARFVACHTALSEGHWGTAAQLELHPLEPTASTSTATMLQAQKHRRLLWKSQGFYPPRGWNNQGKGKTQQGEKGKKGGGKDKGRGKGKGNGKGGDWNQNAKGGANPWKENKEEAPKN